MTVRTKYEERGVLALVWNRPRWAIRGMVLGACLLACAPNVLCQRRMPVVELQKHARAGIEWLVAHQDPASGAWESDGFSQHCTRRRGDPCTEPGWSNRDVGVTSLALMALIADPEARVEHAGSIDKAIEWLAQWNKYKNADGLLASRASNAFSYDHYLGTLALAEVAMALDRPDVLVSIQKAVAYTERIHVPTGGWRYCFDRDMWKRLWADHYADRLEEAPWNDPVRHDLRSTSWALLSLAAAERAGAEVPASVVAEGAAFASRCVDWDGQGALAMAVAELAETRDQRGRWKSAWKEAYGDGRSGAPTASKYRRQLDERIETLEQQISRGPQPRGLIDYDGTARVWSATSPKSRELEAAALRLGAMGQLSWPGEVVPDVLSMLEERCLELAPDPNARTPDPRSFYWVSYALMARSSEATRTARNQWFVALDKTLDRIQADDECAEGSIGWFYNDHEHMGRVATTALTVLACEAPWGTHLQDLERMAADPASPR